MCIRIAAFLLCISLSPLASAEYCWMLGCKDLVGYIPLSKGSAERTADMIAGSKNLPRVGSRVALAEYVYLRAHPALEPKGPYILGPGTIVKVLDIVSAEDKRMFAIIRILDDRNTRNEECRMTINCTATFY